MSDVDKQLKELDKKYMTEPWIQSGFGAYAPGLAAALLRARVVLFVGMKELRDAAKMLRSQGKDFQAERFDNSANELEEILADSELEELLR